MNSSPPSRLVTLTHCIRHALSEGNQTEVGLLLAKRSREVELMVEGKISLSLEERQAIQDADDLLLITMREKRNSAVEQLRQTSLKKRAVHAYKSF